MLLNRAAVIVLVLIAASSPFLPTASSLPALMNGISFPAGTFVIPMDDKQVDRIQVFGLVHALLRSPNPIQLFRIIEPPDVSLSTSLTTSPTSFSGGPFLVRSSDAAKVTEVKSRPEFVNVTVGTLSVDAALDNVLRLIESTRILVVQGEPAWGRTDMTLDAMKIPYNITTHAQLAANPDMMFSYTLIVIDCNGWNGNIPSQIAGDLRTEANSGHEVIFTDRALMDLDLTFPGYVTLSGLNPSDRVSAAYAYNPPRKYDPTKYGASADRFTPEYSSQYYNAPPSPNEINVYTDSMGIAVSAIPSGRVNDVRILADSWNFGSVGNEYGIFAFYFAYGEGVVEGLAFHPQEQSKSTVGDNGYYAAYEFYGNEFLNLVSIPVTTTTQTTAVTTTTVVSPTTSLMSTITTITLTQTGTTVTQTSTIIWTTMSVICGTVYWYDRYGNLHPLAWAQVTATSQEGVTTVTSSYIDGTYVMWLAPETYNVTASSEPGFIPQAHEVTVTLGGVATVDFNLEPSGTSCTTCTITTTLSQSTTTESTAVTQTTGGLQMQVVSNSTVTGLIFDSTRGILNFTVSGPQGTYGFFDATVAKTLLSGQPVVLIDGVQTSATVSGDTNFWYIHVTYPHSQHHVTIGGSNTVPEFPQAIPLLLALFSLALVLLCSKRRYGRPSKRAGEPVSLEKRWTSTIACSGQHP